jgi:hypothetical protein
MRHPSLAIRSVLALNLLCRIPSAIDTLVTQDEFFVNCSPILDREAAHEGSSLGDAALPSSKKRKQTA